MATFTAGTSVVTGDLITAANWNNYMGADGSIDYLYSALNWKASPDQVLSDTDRTTDQDWTDLDLTAYTSANARLVFLRLRIHIDSVSTGQVSLNVRKNGDTPSYWPLVFFTDADGRTAGGDYYAIVMCGMDSGQVIEYKIDVSGTIQVDSYIEVLGYIE
ncbi:MAG: hypothetical protein ACFFD4_07805 [Candidatus Odinarchaeota archaeon]